MSLFKKAKNLLVLSSPSGGGKTTLAKHLMQVFPQLKFSVSCTTRAKRPDEIEEMHYYFISEEEFKEKIANNEFAEYEEIFGNFYGTLKNEIQRHIDDGNSVLFDVDVKGAISLKNAYPDSSYLVFITPPNIEILNERLKNRGTETEEQRLKRLARAETELNFKEQFDYVLINDDLETAINEIEKVAKKVIE
ncbi:MAG: guanylate kinase [Candidatus Kapaibacteriota bacterium]|jgi:guanylate kinase